MHDGCSHDSSETEVFPLVVSLKRRFFLLESEINIKGPFMSPSITNGSLHIMSIPLDPIPN